MEWEEKKIFFTTCLNKLTYLQRLGQLDRLPGAEKIRAFMAKLISQAPLQSLMQLEPLERYFMKEMLMRFITYFPTIKKRGSDLLARQGVALLHDHLELIYDQKTQSWI